MINKISDKDKEDWENFLKKKNYHKDVIKKKDLNDKKIISGDAEKIKTVYDTWVFSKDTKSSNPNWLLIDTLT